MGGTSRVAAIDSWFPHPGAESCGAWGGSGMAEAAVRVLRRVFVDAPCCSRCVGPVAQLWFGVALDERGVSPCAGTWCIAIGGEQYNVG